MESAKQQISRALMRRFDKTREVSLKLTSIETNNFRKDIFPLIESSASVMISFTHSARSVN